MTIAPIFKRCIVCGSSKPDIQLNLGNQPVSSHFISSNDPHCELHPLALGQCRICGTVQVLDPFPYQSLTPPFDWITYREPEGHLDDFVDRLGKLPGIQRNDLILGLSFKDTTTLERLSAQGLRNVHTLDLHDDIGAQSPNANIESVPGCLTLNQAKEIRERRGKARVLIARHVVEHARDLEIFMLALTELLDYDGYLVLEVPDCSGNIERQDPLMIWEEHNAYFSETSFHGMLTRLGFEIVLAKRYPLNFEDCLCAVGQKRGVAGSTPNASPGEISAFSAFAKSFENWKTHYRRMLEQEISNGGRVVLYGAGHLSCAFINFLDLSDLVSAVVDDTTEKQGLRLPKCRTPIVANEYLLEQSVTLSLLGLSVEIEDKVIARNHEFIDAGGRFASIFAASSRSLRADIAEVQIQ